MALMDVVDKVYQAGNGLWQEFRQRDTWVYCQSRGNLPQQGGTLSVHYLGRKRFADDFLMFYDRDAIDAAVEQSITYTASLQRFLRERRALTSCPEGADVLIVDHLFEGNMRGQAVDTLAPHINGSLQVEDNMDAQLEAVRSKGHRRKLQAALKRGIRWRRTHSLADFNLFYDVMYEPFVAERFRYGASVVPRQDMQRMFVQRGFLLLVEEDGVPVSGALIYTSRRDRGMMCYWKYGLAGADKLSPNVFGDRNAAQEACVLQYAVDAGFRRIDWGLTKAIPTDGIFAHKKRVGCDFHKTPNAPDFRILIHPRSRARFLSRFPLIVSHNQQLEGRIAFEPPSNQRLGLKQLGETLSAMSFPSLKRTRVYVPAQLAQDAAVVETCRLASEEIETPVTIEAIVDTPAG